MKQKIVTLLLAGTMIVSLAACGREDASQENSNENVQRKREDQRDKDAGKQTADRRRIYV